MKPKTGISSFTLLELIIVIVVVGVLATLTVRQYSYNTEFARTAEAKIRIGTMKLLAYEHYLRNGSLTDIQNSDVDTDDTCSSAGFYRYRIGVHTSSWLNLVADRCTIDGKAPNGSMEYIYYLWFYPRTGENEWQCYYVDDGSPCFGLPTGPYGG